MAGTVQLDAELINFVLALPSLAKLTSKEAGAFLRVSQSTLERWRRDGSGPEYIQSGIKGSRGTNQTVRYRKQALLEWEAANTVRSSREAAIRKGQM